MQTCGTSNPSSRAAPRGARTPYHSILFVGYEDAPVLPGGGRFLVADSNRQEKDLTYEAAKKRMCDLFWLNVEPKRNATAQSAASL